MAGPGASCTGRGWQELAAEDIPEVVLVPVQKTYVPTPPRLLTSAVVAQAKSKNLL